RGRIVVRGLHVEHWLDGERVVNVDLDSAEAEASFQQSKRVSRHMLRRQEKRRSPVALQIHDGRVEFRKLRMKALK
ncbi:MAG: family 16 glycoside hydrolase, partial [Acidobacteriota bacterium]